MRDEDARRVGGQRAHLDLAVTVRVALARALAQPPRTVLALGAVEEEERDGGLVRDAEEGLEQFERRLVGPVEVLEDEAERLLVGELVDELREDFERPRLDALSVQLADGALGLGLEGHPDEAREERVRLLGFVFAQQVGELGLQLQADARLRRRRAHAEPLPEEVADRPVGEGLRVGDPARLDEARAVAIAVTHLPDEPRLADSWLAHDGDDCAATLDERVHRPLEHRELEVAADQRQAGRDRLRLEDLRDPEGLQPLPDPLEVLGAHLLELEAGLDLALCRGTDDDAPAIRDLLEARGHVDGVAERVERVVAILAVAREPDDDRASVDADPDRELDGVGGLDLLSVLSQRSLDGERCSERALGVVLVRDGNAEECEHFVPHELRHGPVEAPHLFGHDPHDLIDQELRPLRAELLADRGRADDVGYEHRDDPPFSRRNRHTRSYSGVTAVSSRRRRSRWGGRGGRPLRRAAHPRAWRAPRRRRVRPRGAALPPRRGSRAAPAPA